MPGRLCVLGAGSWGTALAIILSRRFDQVTLWSHNAERAAEMQVERSNKLYLAGFPFPGNVEITADAHRALDRCSILLIAIPSHALRETMARIRPLVRSGTLIVSATKGLEQDTLSTMSQVISSVLELGDRAKIAVLSGPTFAKEVAAGEPAAVVIAAHNPELAGTVQTLFSSQHFRLYTTTDVVGVEVGSALKNVIAIGAGICSGLGLGSNSIAALVTRGLAEITRLAVSLGGSARTLSGLAGLGDLVLTATGNLSRNRHVGVELGKGRKLSDILQDMHMVAEGVDTCKAARALGIRQRTELPIIEQMYRVLYEGKDPQTAIRQLMERPLTTE